MRNSGTTLVEDGGSIEFRIGRLELGFESDPEMEICCEVEQDESVIVRVTAVQWEELESETTGLQTEVARLAEEMRELAGEVPF